MIISIFNKKGGTGKTSLAFNIAKDLDFFLLSNDDSNIESLYPHKAKVLEKIYIPKTGNIIFDLGGFIDADLINLFKQSNLIIIPTTLDVNAIKRTINAVLEIKNYNKNIMLIINRISPKTTSKFKESIDVLKKLSLPLYRIRESEAINNSIHTGKTILELSLGSPLAKNAYKGIVSDYEAILHVIKEQMNDL